MIMKVWEGWVMFDRFGMMRASGGLVGRGGSRTAPTGLVCIVRFGEGVFYGFRVLVFAGMSVRLGIWLHGRARPLRFPAFAGMTVSYAGMTKVL